MRKFLPVGAYWLSILFLVIFQAMGWCQSPVLTGVVLDSAGSPLPGASVVIKGSVMGTSTDANGNFSFSSADPIASDAALLINYAGFHSQEVPIGNTTDFRILLKVEGHALNEIVVTALGIKREEKSLGYATQNLKENSFTDARSVNWVSNLKGKVAGINVIGTGSGPVSSSRITLRGESSLNLDNNQALIVVDGIPVNNRMTGTGRNAHLAADSPVDFGTSVSDLNPEDIEKVTVLKGPAATALYGSRAANGALIITTKSGSREAKGLGLTYNTSFSIDRVLKWPDYQYEYGEGRTSEYYCWGDSPDGINTGTNVASGRAFGPKFNGQMYYQYDPNSPDGKAAERTLWKPYKNYIKGFFKTGTTKSHNFSLEGSTEKSAARLSFTYMKNDWIVPNTGFSRYNAALSLSHSVSKKLKINSKVNYVNKRSDNLPLAGYNNQTIMYFMIIGTSPNIDINWFKNYWVPGREQVQQKRPSNPGPDNVYLQVNEMLNSINKQGVIGNISATYEFTPKVNLSVRTGMDMGFEERTQQRPYSMTKFLRGMYREQTIFNFENNTDALLSYKETINNKINLSLSAGGNIMQQKNNFVGLYADQLTMPGVYMLSNSLDPAVTEANRTRRAINSVYGLAQLDYMSRIFVDVTGRNDWSSTLPVKNNSFFYPSLSTSFIMNEILSLPSQISFAKIRLSGAQVGNDTRPYQNARYYSQIYGNSFTNASTLFNSDLKPEITTSYEAGIDLRLFHGRVGLDFTVYTNDSRNQILEIPVDITSGYSRFLTNAGLINSKGSELLFSVKPISGRKFGWNTTITWSANRSYVKKLAEGVSNQVLANHNENVSIEARVGGRMGDMYGRGFQRSPDGQIIYAASGVPAELDPTIKKWGNAFPDWRAGIMNEFSYKKIRLSILFDGQKGGSVYSQTNHKNNTLGKTKVTLPGRDGGIIGEGVVKNADGSFAPNTTRVTALQYYDEYYKISNTETNIFDASYIKLREARIEFGIPSNLVNRVGINQMSIALFGRDLFLWTKFPAFDPEAAMLNNGSIIPGIEMAQFPSTRTMGINLTAKF